MIGQLDIQMFIVIYFIFQFFIDHFKESSTMQLTFVCEMERDMSRSQDFLLLFLNIVALHLFKTFFYISLSL